jgi:hypothetical protein
MCKLTDTNFFTSCIGNPLASGLAMKYKDSCGEMQLVKMVVAGQNKRQGQCWVASMQKVLHVFLYVICSLNL